MNCSKTIPFFCTIAVFFFSANGLAKSNDFSPKPTVPSNKTKITAPSSPPPVSVSPTKKKPSASQPAVSTKTPKPSAPKASVKKPKSSKAKPASVKFKPAPPSRTLPPSIGRKGLPPVQIPADLGRATHIPGSAVRDMSRTNVGGQMPAGHKTAVGGFGSRSGAAGLSQGVSLSTGVESAQETFSDKLGATFVTGAGAQRQGQESGEQQQQEIEEMTFTEEESKADYDAWMDELEKEWYDQSPGNAEDARADHEADAKDEAEDTGTQPPGETTSERTVDGDPGDGSHTGKGVNQNKVKAIFSGGSGIQFAPGEEPTGGGPINVDRLKAIQSGQTQVHTVDGIDVDSGIFEDLGAQAQKTIQEGGYNPAQDL